MAVVLRGLLLLLLLPLLLPLSLLLLLLLGAPVANRAFRVLMVEAMVVVVDSRMATCVGTC